MPEPGNLVAFQGDVGELAPSIVLGVHPLRGGETEPDLDLLVVVSHDAMLPGGRSATVELQGIRFGLRPGQWQLPADVRALATAPPLDPSRGPTSVTELYRMPTGSSASKWVRPAPTVVRPSTVLERMSAAADVLRGRAAVLTRGA